MKEFNRKPTKIIIIIQNNKMNFSYPMKDWE